MDHYPVRVGGRPGVQGSVCEGEDNNKNENLRDYLSS